MQDDIKEKKDIQEKKDTQEKKKMGRAGRKAISVLLIAAIIVVLAGAIGVGVVYTRASGQDGFLKGTTLDGESVEGQTAQELVETIAGQFAAVKVEIDEKGKKALAGSLAQFGCSLDQKGFQEYLDAVMEKQKSNPIEMMKAYLSGQTLSTQEAVSFDEKTLKKYAVSASFAEPRVESKDARLEVDPKTDLYVVAQAVHGNEIDDAKLQDYVKAQISAALEEGSVLDNGGTIKIDVPDDVYLNKQVKTDTSQLEQELAEKNKELRREEFKKMSVTYTFGSQTEVLSGDTISGWVQIDDDLKVTVDQDKVKEYVSGLADQYNTRWHSRTFQTTGGGTITFDGGKNEYGYTIDEDAEAAQLTKDIEGRKSVKRDPVYVTVNDWNNPLYYSRNGKDDLAGTYVEVDLTRQHLWFYKNGSLIVDTDLVSGCVANGTETNTGVYPLAYKEQNVTLTGQNAEESWNSDVDYWMPFTSGQGLHDAPWRSSFGGDIYKTNGSHGCINLPPSAAASIYENIQAGMAIIVYKS